MDDLTRRSFSPAPTLQTKLALDNLISPTPVTVSREIAIFVDAVRQMAGPDPTVPYKVAAIRRVIYEGGPWNGNRPFGYDLADPFGFKVEKAPVYLHEDTERLGWEPSEQGNQRGSLLGVMSTKEQ